ncbi:hypothetical protein HMPREF1531_02461 [Propionibacterium sp. oral taxon 192 str. F0372]|uniref:DUF3107 domain-containing protein n=1 Tax=Propionibacterium sp. oral taxon 192 TaxID=671222 RepID=UPI0003528E6A|nr:DUF3107 domain-containing protein [Propionibacterium sp. oral taxon 192]EPH00353.1 hypothetical protein HMPREF1531_02461 [Propionibacterium sp. oral taxon 192 str. F0372]
MEIKIGVRHIGRELNVETEESAEEIEGSLRDALCTEGGIVVINATKGRRILLPAAQIAYLELATKHPRTVGFGFSGGSD